MFVFRTLVKFTSSILSEKMMPFRVHDGQSLILFWKAVELCLVIGCGDSYPPPTSDLVIPTLYDTINWFNVRLKADIS